MKNRGPKHTQMDFYIPWKSKHTIYYINGTLSQPSSLGMFGIEWNMNLNSLGSQFFTNTIIYYCKLIRRNTFGYCRSFSPSTCFYIYIYICSVDHCRFFFKSTQVFAFRFLFNVAMPPKPDHLDWRMWRFYYAVDEVCIPNGIGDFSFSSYIPQASWLYIGIVFNQTIYIYIVVSSCFKPVSSY